MNNPVKVEVSERPSNVLIDEITIEKNLCHANSINVAKNNNNVEIIEGVLLIIAHDNSAKAIAHVWNKLDDKYFDITNEKILSKDESIIDIIGETQYFEVARYESADFNIGDTFEFLESTKSYVKQINDELSLGVDTE